MCRYYADSMNILENAYEIVLKGNHNRFFCAVWMFDKGTFYIGSFGAKIILSPLGM